MDINFSGWSALQRGMDDLAGFGMNYMAAQRRADAEAEAKRRQAKGLAFMNVVQSQGAAFEQSLKDRIRTGQITPGYFEDSDVRGPLSGYTVGDGSDGSVRTEFDRQISAFTSSVLKTAGITKDDPDYDLYMSQLKTAETQYRSMMQPTYTGLIEDKIVEGSRPTIEQALALHNYEGAQQAIAGLNISDERKKALAQGTVQKALRDDIELTARNLGDDGPAWIAARGNLYATPEEGAEAFASQFEPKARQQATEQYLRTWNHLQSMDPKAANDMADMLKANNAMQSFATDKRNESRYLGASNQFQDSLYRGDLAGAQNQLNQAENNGVFYKDGQLRQWRNDLEEVTALLNKKGADSTDKAMKQKSERNLALLFGKLQRPETRFSSTEAMQWITEQVDSQAMTLDDALKGRQMVKDRSTPIDVNQKQAMTTIDAAMEARYRDQPGTSKQRETASAQAYANFMNAYQAATTGGKNPTYEEAQRMAQGAISLALGGSDELTRLVKGGQSAVLNRTFQDYSTSDFMKDSEKLYNSGVMAAGLHNGDQKAWELHNQRVAADKLKLTEATTQPGMAQWFKNNGRPTWEGEALDSLADNSGRHLFGYEVAGDSQLTVPVDGKNLLIVTVANGGIMAWDQAAKKFVPFDGTTLLKRKIK